MRSLGVLTSTDGYSRHFFKKMGRAGGGIGGASGCGGLGMGRKERRSVFTLVEHHRDHREMLPVQLRALRSTP